MIKIKALEDNLDKEDDWRVINFTEEAPHSNDKFLYNGDLFYLNSVKPVKRFTGQIDAEGNEIYEGDILEPTFDDANFNHFSYPVVKWNGERYVFQLVSKCDIFLAPKMINTSQTIQGDYEIDHIHKVRYEALTPEVSRQYVVCGNNLEDDDY